MENETEVQNQTELCPLTKVLLHNDDKNEMAYVAEALMIVFTIHGKDAVPIMLEAHEQGVALITVIRKEEAELRKEQMAGFTRYSPVGIVVSLEEA